MARREWPWIRLLLSDLSVTYKEVREMDIDEVMMLNEAIDLHNEQIKKENKQK